MKVANAIAEFLRDAGVRHVFLVSGGGNLHLIKAIAETEGIDYVCPQNETSAAYAADCYARLAGIGCALSTSGPGATNLISGIATSFYDSIPCLYLTGNVTRARMSAPGTVRQTGFQETPITDLVGSITKYAHTIMEPDHTLPCLRSCLDEMRRGRPGPGLLDIPDDIARADIAV